MARSESCIWCGDTRVKRVKASQFLSVNGDRHCVNCGTIWAPPLPACVAVIFLVFWVPAGLGALAFTVYSLVGPDIDGVGRIQGLLVGPFATYLAWLGVRGSLRSLRGEGRTPKIVHQGREELRLGSDEAERKNA